MLFFLLLFFITSDCDDMIRQENTRAQNECTALVNLTIRQKTFQPITHTYTHSHTLAHLFPILPFLYSLFFFCMHTRARARHATHQRPTPYPHRSYDFHTPHLHYCLPFRQSPSCTVLFPTFSTLPQHTHTHTRTYFPFLFPHSSLPLFFFLPLFISWGSCEHDMMLLSFPHNHLFLQVKPPPSSQHILPAQHHHQTSLPPHQLNTQHTCVFSKKTQQKKINAIAPLTQEWEVTSSV